MKFINFKPEQPSAHPWIFWIGVLMTFGTVTTTSLFSLRQWMYIKKLRTEQAEKTLFVQDYEITLEKKNKLTQTCKSHQNCTTHQEETKNMHNSYCKTVHHILEKICTKSRSISHANITPHQITLTFVCPSLNDATSCCTEIKDLENVTSVVLQSFNAAHSGIECSLIAYMKCSREKEV